MRGSTVLLLTLLALLALVTQTASAGSAVAWDGYGHLGASAGYPVREAKQRALRRCRRDGGVNPWIVGSTDVVGDGAIAVARRGSGFVIGISLGRPSPADAENRAIEKCLKAGGIDPKVRWGFRG